MKWLLDDRAEAGEEQLSTRIVIPLLNQPEEPP
jgi:hypothetical protein